MDGSASFGSGFVAGFVTATVLILVTYSLWSIISGYITKIRAADRPQVVVHTSSKTPNQVVDEASLAKRRLWFLFIVVYIVAIGILEVLRPGTIKSLLALFGL